jgi:5-methylcytosine-specific restriction endonuclease McrA
MLRENPSGVIRMSEFKVVLRMPDGSTKEGKVRGESSAGIAAFVAAKGYTLLSVDGVPYQEVPTQTIQQPIVGLTAATKASAQNLVEIVCSQCRATFPESHDPFILDDKCPTCGGLVNVSVNADQMWKLQPRTKQFDVLAQINQLHERDVFMLMHKDRRDVSGIFMLQGTDSESGAVTDFAPVWSSPYYHKYYAEIQPDDYVIRKVDFKTIVGAILIQFKALKVYNTAKFLVNPSREQLQGLNEVDQMRIPQEIDISSCDFMIAWFHKYLPEVNIEYDEDVVGAAVAIDVQYLADHRKHIHYFEIANEASLLVYPHLRVGIEANIAMNAMPPPPKCGNCGEMTWDFVSLSPNRLSAQWQCQYCSKKVLIRKDPDPEADDRPRREPIPKDVQAFVWNRDSGKCVACGSNENLEFDHIIAFSRGGANTARNLQLLCQVCNRAKSAATPGDY